MNPKREMENTILLPLPAKRELKALRFQMDNNKKSPDHLLKEGEWWHNYYNWEDFSQDLPIYENFTFCSAS